MPTKKSSKKKEHNRSSTTKNNINDGKRNNSNINNNKDPLNKKEKNSKEMSIVPVPKEGRTLQEVPIKVRKMFNLDGSFNRELFFELMGNDIRRKILSKLAKFPRYASDLAIDLGVSKQAVKKHLAKLEEFGLITTIEISRQDQKIQYYQIDPNVAIFAQIDLTPNYFSIHAVNSPEALEEGLKDLTHDPSMAITTSRYGSINYDELNYSLRTLGKQLHNVEKKLDEIENKRQEAIIEKTILLNRIQMIINALVENDLEKEVIFSFFFDVKSSIEGMSLMDIVNQLFLRKKKRAGSSKFKYDRPDERMLKRAKDLLDLLRLLINNFGFIRQEGRKLFFDFDTESF